MTTLKKLLLTDLEYNIWANQLLLRNASQLTEEERSRNLGASHASLVRTLRHIYDAERFWIRSLITDSIPSVAEIDAAGAADRARPDPTLDSLKDEWPEVWDEARRWAGPLDDNDLAKELNCRMRNGIDLPVPRWSVLRHMVNHSSIHRGQIITMLRALGQRPPNLDLFTYYQLEAIPK